MSIFIQVLRMADDGSAQMIFCASLPSTASETGLRGDIEEALKPYREPLAGNHKAVFVKHINEQEFNKYLEGVASEPPSNGLYAQPIFDGQTFPSAAALSAHLGFRYNEVAQALQKSKSNPDPAERTAKVRGVTVIYERDDTLAFRD